MQYITITEAARRCGVATKTIQRAIRDGKLKAAYPHKNRARITMDDLETYRSSLPGQHVQTQTALEERVANLEKQLQVLLAHPPNRAPVIHIPDGSVKLADFERLHNVARAGVQATIKDKQFHPGKMHDGTEILDAAGQALFWQLFHDEYRWRSCADCPHGGAKTLTVTLWLVIYGNNKYIRGKRKVLDLIERDLQPYRMEKGARDPEYLLTLIYQDDDELENIIDEISREIGNTADTYNFQVEMDFTASDGSGRSW
ncbi:hypothetical protein KDH_79670 [Dictyobacter sp. S3.2.2.5]|uniref:Helix-turn-helix domain-containing protein n=1 Tax=Dictyobacter halimunensis TaxID=3026934 RepID=A0ABQ6G3Q8_9CHLR|nr:hypothetical protein KDH_79670 [Dictyobacter sp. S3.2.2.5]